MRDALANGDTVSVTGFGRFSTKSRPGRTGRDPRSGERVANAAAATTRPRPITGPLPCAPWSGAPAPP
ncbi:MAG: HU family DNA-binding protein [Deltaproteobacteria bacterium]|nr:HU family DNA-binding protein [Deltaproteobacteria bacterium]